MNDHAEWFSDILSPLFASKCIQIDEAADAATAIYHLHKFMLSQGSATPTDRPTCRQASRQPHSSHSHNMLWWHFRLNDVVTSKSKSHCNALNPFTRMNSPYFPAQWVQFLMRMHRSFCYSFGCLNTTTSKFFYPVHYKPYHWFEHTQTVQC